jgi:hypothetical protein
MGRIYTSFPWLDLELFSDHSLVIQIHLFNKFMQIIFES